MKRVQVKSDEKEPFLKRYEEANGIRVNALGNIAWGKVSRWLLNDGEFREKYLKIKSKWMGKRKIKPSKKS